MGPGLVWSELRKLRPSSASEEIALHCDLALRGLVDWDYGVQGRPKDVTKE